MGCECSHPEDEQYESNKYSIHDLLAEDPQLKEASVSKHLFESFDGK